MSDAMSKTEIEDVLTSIRRLVAQEGGRGSQAGRLILTEAQRVLDASERQDAGTRRRASAGQAIPGPDFGRLEQTIAELEAAVGAGPTSEWRPDAAPVTAPAVRDDVPEEGAGRASNVTALHSRLSFNTRPRPDVAPEAASEAADVADAPATDAVASKVEVTSESQATSEQGQQADSTVPPEATMDASPLDAGDDAQALPEAPESVEADMAPPSEPEAHDAVDDFSADLLADDSAAILDEETLRDMVAQIVREELHGQLGERITQQVRKLVRAEIARALADRTYL